VVEYDKTAATGTAKSNVQVKNARGGGGRGRRRRRSSEIKWLAWEKKEKEKVGKKKTSKEAKLGRSNEPLAFENK